MVRPDSVGVWKFLRAAVLIAACVPMTGPVVPASPAGVATRVELQEIGVPRTGTTAWPVVDDSPWPASAGRCADGDCWVARANEAVWFGNLDVAASHREQAFLMGPTVARLDAWIDALIAVGALRRAREGLIRARGRASRDIVAAVDRRLAMLPAVLAVQEVARTELTPALTAAYTAEVLGNWEEAADRFTAADPEDPVHLARAGMAEARRGSWVAARRAWAAARTRFLERGASVVVAPVDRGLVTTADWRGEELATLWMWKLRDVDDWREAGVLELRAPVVGAPARRLYLPSNSEVLAFTGDGRSFLVEEDGRIVKRDLLSGTTRRVVAAVDGYVSGLAVTGVDEDLLALAIVRWQAELWDARGQQLAEFPLPGKETSAMKVAMTAKAALVAVGASDGTVHVFDRVRATSTVLPAQMKRVKDEEDDPPEQRLKALGFIADERLVVLYEHGEIVVWEPRSGQALARHAGRCTAAEVEAGQSELARCVEVRVGTIGADGSVTSQHGHRGYRVRSAETGQTRMFGGADMPAHHVMLSRSGLVGIVDFKGATAVVGPAGRVDRLAEDIDLRHQREVSRITSDGRVLHFVAGGRDHVWDLLARRRLPVTRGPEEKVLALSKDGRFAAIDVGFETVEVRATDTGAPVFSRAFKGWIYGLVANSGHAVFHEEGREDAEKMFARPDGTGAVIEIAEMPLAISDDGVWLVSVGAKQTTVRRLDAPETVVHTLDRVVTGAAFSRDGTQLAWFSAGEARVGVMRLSGPRDRREVRLPGRLQEVTFSADGREVWMLFDDGGKFVRWWPATGKLLQVEQDSLRTAQGVVASADGATMLMASHDRVQVRINDRGMRRIGAVHSLMSGGWLAVSASGAIDGSEDAPAMTITRVEEAEAERDEEAYVPGSPLPVRAPRERAEVFDGRLGWDGAHVPGMAARLLAGEDVAAPVLVRTPLTEQKPSY